MPRALPPCRRVLACLLSMTLLAPTGAAFAVTMEDAKKVVEHFSKLPRPGRADTEFAHWTYNTALFTAGGCWDAVSPDQNHPALEQRITRGGAYALLRGTEMRDKVCASIAQSGFQPRCINASSVNVVTGPVSDLPRDYVVFNGKPEKIELDKGLLTCYVDATRAREQKFYTPMHLEWTRLPEERRFTLYGGERILRAGNVRILVPEALGLDGKPFSENRIAVQLEP